MEGQSITSSEKQNLEIEKQNNHFKNSNYGWRWETYSPVLETTPSFDLKFEIELNILAHSTVELWAWQILSSYIYQ